MNSGQGIQQYSNGASYNGTWNENQRHGRGEYRFGSLVYEGEWVNGRVLRNLVKMIIRGRTERRPRHNEDRYLLI